MKQRYFGDSYDIVKHALIRWLADFGPWAVHPMFTESVGTVDSEAFGRLLNARVVSTEILSPMTDRKACFSLCEQADNLLLDPDIGLRVEPGRRREASYLFAHELVRLATARRGFLTMVFDQSVGRGRERDSIGKKLAHLASHNVYGFAYVSHSSFIIVAADAKLTAHALDTIISRSALPASRFLLHWR